MVKVNVSRTQLSLSIAIAVALTSNLRKLNFSQKSQRMSESFEYVGPGALLTCPPHSAIRVHCEQACLSPVSYDNFKILAAAPDLVSLRILESLHIFKSKPKLNDSDSSFPLNIVH